MVDIDLVGFILKARATSQSDDTITSGAKTKGFSDAQISEATTAIENDDVFRADALFIFTWLNPITYVVGINKLTAEKKIILGLMKNTQEIGIRTIDNVRIYESLVGADVIVEHADQTEVKITGISKKAARVIEKLFGYIIEAQRAKVINVAQD